MRVDEEGWLEPGDGDPAVVRFPTNKTSKLDDPTPSGVVWHETGYLGVSIKEFCARQMPADLHHSSREASEHLVIERGTGDICQLSPFLVGTWHVGQSGTIAGKHYSNINHATVGIELESYGRLKKVDGVWRYFVDGKWEGEVPEEEVRHAVQDGGYFHDFNDNLVNSATLVLGALVDAYGWGQEVCSYGHADFADHASREDPGPLWGCQFWKHGIYLPKVLAGVFAAGDVTVGDQ